MSAIDEQFMRAALSLARRTLGRTWPNPAVGAIVVDPRAGNEIVARGWTMPGGRPHAERMALEAAGEKASGCTIYVTLEPCAHHGKTPPCADAIIEAGIDRVVCSVSDPDPRVAEEGLSRLRKAGIDVAVGVLAQEGTRLALGHILRVTRNRPMVQLKLAVGADKLVPRGNGGPRWVTGETARTHAHLLRARSDAILVGRGTIEADDPELTCRLPGMADRSPVRVVLDSALTLTPGARLFADIDHVPVWVFCAEDAEDKSAENLLQAGAEVIKVRRSDRGLDLAAMLAELARRGITRLLVEGGPQVASSFVHDGFVDEIYIYEGMEKAGSEGMKPLYDERLELISSEKIFTMDEIRTLGVDRLTVWRRRTI